MVSYEYAGKLGEPTTAGDEGQGAMNKYLLFYAYKDYQGGAYDFHSIHDTIEAARQAGIDYWSDGDVRLSSWMHLAHLTDGGLKVIEVLDIPGTEWDDDDTELAWRAV